MSGASASPGSVSNEMAFCLHAHFLLCGKPDPNPFPAAKCLPSSSPWFHTWRGSGPATMGYSQGSFATLRYSGLLVGSTWLPRSHGAPVTFSWSALGLGAVHGRFASLTLKVDASINGGVL